MAMRAYNPFSGLSSLSLTAFKAVSAVVCPLPKDSTNARVEIAGMDPQRITAPVICSSAGHE